jgi:UDP-3-O-[3-hydroxymyristoyl] glucosamine N-acyltransferase
VKKFRQSLTPEAIQKIIGGESVVKRSVSLCSIADPKEAQEHSVIFVDSEKFLPLVLSSEAGLIIAGSKFKNELQSSTSNLIFVENSYRAILILIHYWQETEKADFVTQVHPTTVIGHNVVLPKHVNIGPYVVIGDNVTIGDYVKIEAFCSVGNNTIIGQNCHFYPHVTVYEDTVIGANVTIHSGSVIGADGFGYLLYEGKQQKIPQIGQVIIHDNVEIGANTSIDKGTIGATIIGEGTKIDNLVQIGHNCVIGKHSILCAQVGLAGSTIIGDYVFLAGQVGVAGHLTIGDGVMIGAQTGVVSDLEAGKKYFGSPAREAMQAKKIMAVENSLPEMYKFYHKLKKEKERE